MLMPFNCCCHKNMNTNTFVQTRYKHKIIKLFLCMAFLYYFFLCLRKRFPISREHKRDKKNTEHKKRHYLLYIFLFFFFFLNDYFYFCCLFYSFTLKYLFLLCVFLVFHFLIFIF